MHTLRNAALVIALGFTSALSAQFTPDPNANTPDAQELILGHNGLQYRVIRDWAKVDHSVAPVINAHAMVEGSDGLYYLVTDHPDNAILAFKPDGTFIKSFGKGLKGGHGIDVIQDGDRELIVHVDCGWAFSSEGKPEKLYGSINLLTKDGELIRTLPSPAELGIAKAEVFYGPCDVAITPNGDILVIDGYSSDRVLHFTKEGELVRVWGGKKQGDPASIQNGHGISIDDSDPSNPVIWIASRDQNQLKRFTMEGEYIDTIDIPGAYAGQAVFRGDHVYTGVCWSILPKTGKRGYQTGFVAVLDRKTGKVISAPGGSEPHYHGDHLHPLEHGHDKTFRHVHDLMVDDDGNIFVMEWNAGCRYPYKLELIKD